MDYGGEGVQGALFPYLQYEGDHIDGIVGILFFPFVERLEVIRDSVGLIQHLHRDYGFDVEGDDIFCVSESSCYCHRLSSVRIIGETYKVWSYLYLFLSWGAGGYFCNPSRNPAIYQYFQDFVVGRGLKYAFFYLFVYGIRQYKDIFTDFWSIGAHIHGDLSQS